MIFYKKETEKNELGARPEKYGTMGILICLILEALISLQRWVCIAYYAIHLQILVTMY